MSYPILYNANETEFSHFGLGVLADTISALVIEERNGQFELVMQYPVDGALFHELKNDRLIKVDASNNLKNQRFKIIRITKIAKRRVTVYAEHVSYLTQDLALEPEVNYTGNALNALSIWRDSIVVDHPFSVYSDITTVGSGKWAINEVVNARRALGGVQGSILDTYGGEYRFDNYHIGLYAQRGDDLGALIAYGKNLIDLEQEEEISNTFTSIYPFSIVYNEDDIQEILTLPELFIDSEHVNNYARRKIQVVDFTLENITSVEQLRARTEAFIIENNVGVPRVNLRVKFVDLAKTLDYQHLKIIEEINLCDLVNIYFEKLDIRQKAKVIKTVWDVLLDRYDSIEIGEARASLSSSIDMTVDSKLVPVENRINTIQVAANGKNKVFRGVDAPINGMTENDLWYKPVGDGEIEMYIYDGGIWRLEAYSADQLGGTLNAANVNVINLNAHNMATGVLSGGKVHFNLDTGTLLIGDNPIDHQLYWDGSMLSVKGIVHIGSNTQFESGYDPSTKETPEGAQQKADTAQQAAEAHAEAVAEAEAAEAQASAEQSAQGYVSVETQARIQQAEANLNEAKLHADQTSAAAEEAAKTYALQQAQVALDTANNNIGTAIDLLESQLGDLAYSDIVEVAQLGTTVIQGGYLRTELIEAGAITADKLSVNNLSAISGNLGTITGGTINGGTINGGNITLSGHTSGTQALVINNPNTTNRVSRFAGGSIQMLTGSTVTAWLTNLLGGAMLSLIDPNNSNNDITLTASLGGRVECGNLLVRGDASVSSLSVNVSGTARMLELNQHMISQNSGNMTMYLNRNSGLFQIRSHADRSSYRDEFTVDGNGDAWIRYRLAFPNARFWDSGNNFGLDLLNAGIDFRIRDRNNNDAFRVYEADRRVRCYANFSVDGTKSAVANTENYGKRLMYALETPDNRFVAYMEKSLSVGEHFIEIEPMFLETISSYFIVPHIQNASQVIILNREEKGFNVYVHSHRAEVVFEINGKRKGFEHIYMEPVLEDKMEDKMEDKEEEN